MARVIKTPAADEDRAASSLEPADTEILGLISSDVQPTPSPSSVTHGRRWRLVSGMVLVGAALATAGVAVRRALAPCTPVAEDADPPSLTSLFEAYPEDLVNLASTPEARDDALAKWLASANSAESPMGQPLDRKEAAQAAKAIQDAMSSQDPASAQKFVQRAMHRAVLRAQDKRRELKKFVGPDTKSFLPVVNASRDLGRQKKTKEQKRQADVATCVFDTTALTIKVAALGSNINDVALTCEDVQADDYFNKHDAHTKVCVINIFMTVITTLRAVTDVSTSVDSCAFTLLPQVDSLCAASVTGLMSAVAGMGGSAALIAAACTNDGWYAKVPAGVTPSNVGSNARYEAKKAGLIPEDGRRLSEEDQNTVAMAMNMSSTHAPERRLLFGGGKGSMATQCATSILSLGWAIAYLGLNINSATSNCPPLEGLAPSIGLKGGIVHKVTQNLCNVDISSAITSFIGIIVYIEFIVYQCSDVINLPAICGSGWASLFASFSGISKAASGLYVACDVAQKPFIKMIINLVNKLGKGGAGLDTTGNFGRRLYEEAVDKVETGAWDAEIEALKGKYSNPAEVWRSIGYDFNDKDAAWQNAAPSKLTKDVLSLIEERAPATSGLFQGQTCS